MLKFRLRHRILSVLLVVAATIVTCTCTGAERRTPYTESTRPLQRIIARQIDQKMLADIAAAHHQGRRLFVVTTNLDAQRPVLWNMGAIAASISRHACIGRAVGHTFISPDGKRFSASFLQEVTC